MKEVSFLNPEFFWLFLLLPAVVLWQLWKRKQQSPTLKISSVKGFKAQKSLLAKLKPFLFVFRLLALSSLIIAMARPRKVDISSQTKSTKGIDIVMAIDVSGSMLAKDLKPNRLEALKRVAAEFVEDRINDRIGLVVYAGESYTRTPVTSDKTVILQSLKTVEYDDSIIADGTGIGVGLGKRNKWPDDYFSTYYELGYKYYDVVNDTRFPIFSKGFANDISLQQTIQRTSVSAPTFPQSGSNFVFLVKATLPYSLFSDKDYSIASQQEKYKYLEYYRLKFTAEWFLPLSKDKKLILMPRIGFGYLGSYNKSKGICCFFRTHFKKISSRS